MKNTTWAGTCGAIVAAATVAVMAQAQQPPPQTSSASPDQITVTGCLKAAPPAAPDVGASGTVGATGTSGTAAPAATDADAKFVLTNATVTPATASSAASAAADQSSADHDKTYRLVANPASLSPHVGKKLELTGTLVNASASTSSAASASPADAPVLRVEKGKIVAASCEQ